MSVVLIPVKRNALFISLLTMVTYFSDVPYHVLTLQHNGCNCVKTST